MPKAPARPEVVEAIRERILKEALFIINKDGYANLSMRKLALRLGFTAKTIYNYYSNKDELYLMALTKGFQELAEQFRAAYLFLDGLDLPPVSQIGIEQRVAYPDDIWYGHLDNAQENGNLR